MLAQRLCEKDPAKITQWDSETVPAVSQVVSGSETSSDEGEPIPQHALHAQYVKATTDAAVAAAAAAVDVSRSYHVPIAVAEPKVINHDARLRGPQFNHQQRRDYTSVPKEQRLIQAAVSAEDAARPAEDSLQSYKCQVCLVSMRTVSELQVHCFVEHNIERDSSTNILHGDRSAGKCREKENTQRITEESSAVKEGHGRQKLEDT